MIKSKWLAQILAVLSALLAGFCPLCIPAAAAFLASFGLGFALSSIIFKPLLALFLLVSVGSLAWSARVHKRWWVVIIGMAGAVCIYTARYLWFERILMLCGAVLLVGVSLLNLWIKVSCNHCRAGK